MTHSSSSEDEEGPSTVVRRRRLRKNTAGSVTELEEEEDEEDEGEVLDVRTQGKGSSILSSCILIALVVAFSAGFGHFYGETRNIY